MKAALYRWLAAVVRRVRVLLDWPRGAPDWRELVREVETSMNSGYVWTAVVDGKQIVGAPLEWSITAGTVETCAWTGILIDNRTGVRCARCRRPILIKPDVSGMYSSLHTPSCPACRRVVKRAIRLVRGGE